MARSIAAGVAGKCLCANPKCRKEFEPANKYGPKPKLCPECREAGVKLPDVAKPSPGKKKHPHPPPKKASKSTKGGGQLQGIKGFNPVTPAAEKAKEPEKPAVTGIVVSDDPDRKKEDSPCYRCTRRGCNEGSVRVSKCEYYMEPKEEATQPSALKICKFCQNDPARKVEVPTATTVEWVVCAEHSAEGDPRLAPPDYRPPIEEVPTGGLVSSNIKINLGEALPAAVLRSLRSIENKPRLRDLEDFFRAWSGGEETAEEFWGSVAAAVWGYLYGRGLAA